MARLSLKKIIPILGLILVLVGIVIVVSAVPIVQRSIWPYEDAVTELAKNVPPINATRIIIGIVVVVAGFVLLFGGKSTKWGK